MEKRATSMLTEDQKKRVLTEMQRFLGMVSEFVKKESELDNCEKTLKASRDELSKVAEEERQMETAMEVVYREEKKESKAKKIRERIETLQNNFEVLNNEMDQLRTSLLKQMRNLPIPVDLENPREEEAGIAFGYFENAQIGEEGINVMCKLFRQGSPFSFSETLFLPDEVIVRNASGKQDALTKLIEGIRSFRMRVDDLLKSYEQIDEMVERVRKSELYSAVLITLLKKGRLSSEAIAKTLNMDKRKVYDTCYNLIRSNWSPAPIKSTPSGEWELTLPGEILVNRLLQKYGEPNLAANIESKIKDNEKQKKEA
jgi:hypothetical protein